MRTYHRLILTCLALWMSMTTFAQDKTINDKKKDVRESSAAHKVMIIPFENRLYLSEIDHHINAESKASAKEIKFKFRDGLNEQLFKSFKSSGYNVLDLMEDTTKYKKDLAALYHDLSYDFQLIPDQDNYKPPKKDKETKKIVNGQLMADSDMEPRFMNAKLGDQKVLQTMYAKYKTDIFVFINELEIKASGNQTPGSLGNGSESRKVIVHYTIYTKEYKEINSGIAETDFEVTLNNQKKIIDKHFSKVAQSIKERTNKALAVK